MKVRVNERGQNRNSDWIKREEKVKQKSSFVKTNDEFDKINSKIGD